MVLLTGMVLGLAALMLRSAVGIATVGTLMVAAFVGEWFMTGNGQALQLLTALVGYNVGIAGGFVLMLTMQKIRPVLR